MKYLHRALAVFRLIQKGATVIVRINFNFYISVKCSRNGRMKQLFDQSKLTSKTLNFGLLSMAS